MPQLGQPLFSLQLQVFGRWDGTRRRRCRRAEVHFFYTFALRHDEKTCVFKSIRRPAPH